MAQCLILEIAGRGADFHDEVNRRLGIDKATGEGDWPDGLLTHIAGEKDGALQVIEVWESRELQDRFMEERLGKALQESGATGPPARQEWIELIAYNVPARATA